MIQNFDALLQKYAELTVRVGLNIQPGQRVAIRGPIEAAPYIREVTAAAYRAGARLVDVGYTDERLTLARFQYAPRDSFEEFPDYIARGMEEYGRNGDAFLSVYSEDPDLLKDQDQTLVSLAEQTSLKHYKAYNDLLFANRFPWSVISVSIPSWAARVFPGLPGEESVERLWEAIFRICRVDGADPVAAWKDHLSKLAARAGYLNAKRYSALHYAGPGTDLTIGLPDGYLWTSGEGTTQGGIRFTANIPTEEVYTLAQRDRVEGTVAATRPLAHAGTLVEGFWLRFSSGKVVDFHADKGEEVLRRLLETDEGARRLGEVSLVPNSSPISQAGYLFNNMLYDENAACHLALGHAYPETLEGGIQMSEEEFARAGGNISLEHDDFMVGSGELDVDGIRADGTSEPVLRKGEWAFSLA